MTLDEDQRAASVALWPEGWSAKRIARQLAPGPGVPRQVRRLSGQQGRAVQVEAGANVAGLGVTMAPELPVARVFPLAGEGKDADREVPGLAVRLAAGEKDACPPLVALLV